MDLSAFSLQGKTIAITGANTGIGQGIALSVARAGGRVIGIGRSAMDETASEVAKIGGDFAEVRADLGSGDNAHAVFNRIAEAHGTIDGLVNNAGIIRRTDAVDFTVEDWDDVMNVNLKSAFFLSQAFARHVFAASRRGKIVNIASLLSFQGGIRVASYTASKSGVLGVTRLLACEWAAKGLNVNAIAPGYIETANTQALRDDPNRSNQILERIPAGRWGAAADIAGAVLFLASTAADYVHGVVLPVDGGWLGR